MPDKQIPLMEQMHRSVTGRLPCPFCGSVKLSLIVVGEKKKPLLIQCSSCGATGPTGKDIKEMDALWDMRASEI